MHPLAFNYCSQGNRRRRNGFFLSSHVPAIFLPTLIAAAVLTPAKAIEPFFETSVYYSGMNGYDTFRIPAIVSTLDGTLLAFAEGRKNGSSDSGDIDLVLRRSLDNGFTWEPMQVVWSNGAGVAGNPVPTVDVVTGDVVLVTNHQPAGSTEGSVRSGTDTRDYCVQRSTDDGASWTDPVRIDALDSLDPRWVAGGPNHGIQLTVGEAEGRIVVAGNHSLGSGFDTNQAHVIYSDDGGFTWERGAVGGETSDIYLSETAAVELADGTLYFTSRDQHGPSAGTRAWSTSSDAGESFDADFQIDSTILSPVCQGSILRYTGTSSSLSDDRILQSYPYSTAREQIAVRSSFDEAQTWTVPKIIYEGSSAYSDLVQTADNRIGLLYERDSYTEITFAGFTTEWLDEGIVEEPIDISDGTFYGFWALNQQSGQTAADSSGNGRDGRLGDDSGADGLDPSWVNDVERGRVASFEKGDYVDLSPHIGAFAGLEQGTISLWMKTTEGGDMAVFAASDSTVGSSEVRLIMEDSQTMWYDVRDQTAALDGEDGHLESIVLVNDGAWHHVVAVVGEDAAARLYVDGTLQATGSEPFFTVASLDTMALGRNVDSGGPQWLYGGLLSDVGVFDKPLSGTMVAAAYALDQTPELVYDLAEAVALFQLEGTEYLELDGRTWYVVQGLTGTLGSVESSGDDFLLRMSEEGAGLATLPGFLDGDADGDGLVGSGDLDLIRAQWGKTVTPGNWRLGDLTGDGTVGSADLDLVRANWGAALAAAAVPEPGVGLLLLMLGLFVGARRCS